MSLLPRLISIPQFHALLLFVLLGFTTWAMAQEQPQPEKRWVQLALIEVPRKSLADSILRQFRKGEAFPKLARKYSLHASAKDGGEIGWVEVDSIESAFKMSMKSLANGKASSVLRKDKRFFILLKMNELAQNGYLQWQARKAEIDTLLKQGSAYFSVSKYSHALACFDSALVIARKIVHRRSEGKCLTNLGIIYASLAQYPRAKEYFESALIIAREIGDRTSEGRCLGNLGNIYGELSEYLRAIAYYDSALSIARKIGNLGSEEQCLGNLGNAYVNLAQYPRAMAYYDSARAIARKTSDRQSEGTWLGNIGNVYLEIAQYPRAIAYFDSALIIAREIGDRNNEGTWLSHLGSAYLLLSQYPRAIAYLDSALVIARQIGNSFNESRHLGGLGNAYLLLAQYRRAIAHFDSGLTIARKIGDRNNEGRYLGNLGNAYLDLAHYSRAIAYYDSALIIAREINDRSSEGSWLGNLGKAYISLAQYPRAIAYFDSALSIARKIDNRSSEETCLGNLGATYASLDQYPRAVAYYDSALMIARKIGDRNNEGTLLANLGLIYLELTQHPRAIAYLDSALSIAREIGDPRGKSRHLGKLGDAYQKLAQYRRAVAYADSALHIVKEINDKEGISRWYWSLAKSHAQIPETQSHQVIAFYEQAVSTLDSIAGQIVEDPHKISFLEDKQELYQDFINYLLAQSGPNEQQRALEISEQARARAFRELIARRFHGSEVQQKRELLAPANFQQIQATAKRLNASILEYFISDSSLVIWLMKPNGQLHTAVAPIKPDHFEFLIAMCQIGFTQRRQEDPAIPTPQFVARAASSPPISTFEKLDFTPYMTELYQVLFPQAIRAHLPQQAGAKLLLVPHHKLAVIPIMALKDSSGRYLLEKYNCHQVPGVGVLLRTHDIIKNRKKLGNMKGTDVLLFGNPKMPTWGEEDLPSLRAAEEEITAIAKKYRAGFQSGEQASEYAFKHDAPNKRLLHLATHGISFDASPLESFIALAPGQGEDGQLTAAEILELKFAADLTVLSACETGLGKVSGDGVEGLARAFMASGVPSLLVSLWKVDDDATRALMLAFYDHLQKGLDKAEALRQAQLKIMRTPQWNSPKYWAAFVLYGER